jgi:acid phosphatase
MHPKSLVLPLLATLLVACGTVPRTAPSAQAPSPADDNLNAVLWVQRSAEYRAVSTSVYRAATRELDRALADPHWDALAAEDRDGTVAAGLPPAVVMDIDETVLDNAPYQARLVVGGGEYDDASWDLWVAERKAEPVPGVVDFAAAAAARGITIVYLSNRAQHLQAATLANLRMHGLPVKDDSVFLGMGTDLGGCADSGSDKGCRRRHVARHYRVLMQFGDQLGDFTRAPAKTTAAQLATGEAHAGWFGERWWMLPNPTYGSWEPALYGNDRTLPAAARRERKRAELDLAR